MTFDVNLSAHIGHPGAREAFEAATARTEALERSRGRQRNEGLLGRTRTIAATTDPRSPLRDVIPESFISVLNGEHGYRSMYNCYSGKAKQLERCAPPGRWSVRRGKTAPHRHFPLRVELSPQNRRSADHGGETDADGSTAARPLDGPSSHVHESGFGFKLAHPTHHPSGMAVRNVIAFGFKHVKDNLLGPTSQMLAFNCLKWRQVTPKVPPSRGHSIVYETRVTWQYYNIEYSSWIFL